MGILPQYKIADCNQCGDKQVPCVKVAKEYFCKFKCHANNKAKQQIDNANKRDARNKVRSLITYERQEGILDSIQELTLDLDRVVSRYVRLAAMDKEHKCECFTCGTRKNWKNIQCGHFIARANLSLRWDLTNLRPQCSNCNVMLHGNLDEYKIRLNKERNGITDWLYEQSKEVAKPSRDELKELLFHFQQKLHLVETKLK